MQELRKNVSINLLFSFGYPATTCQEYLVGWNFTKLWPINTEDTESDSPYPFRLKLNLALYSERALRTRLVRELKRMIETMPKHKSFRALWWLTLENTRWSHETSTNVSELVAVVLALSTLSRPTSHQAQRYLNLRNLSTNLHSNLELSDRSQTRALLKTNDSMWNYPLFIVKACFLLETINAISVVIAKSGKRLNAGNSGIVVVPVISMLCWLWV